MWNKLESQCWTSQVLALTTCCSVPNEDARWSWFDAFSWIQIHNVLCCALQDEANANSLHPQVWPASIRTRSQLNVVLAVNEGGHISTGKRARMVAAWEAGPQSTIFRTLKAAETPLDRFCSFCCFRQFPTYKTSWLNMSGTSETEAEEQGAGLVLLRAFCICDVLDPAAHVLHTFFQGQCYLRHECNLFSVWVYVCVCACVCISSGYQRKMLQWCFPYTACCPHEGCKCGLGWRNLISLVACVWIPRHVFVLNYLPWSLPKESFVIRGWNDSNAWPRACPGRYDDSVRQCMTTKHFVLSCCRCCSLYTSRFCSHACKRIHFVENR